MSNEYRDEVQDAINEDIQNIIDEFNKNKGKVSEAIPDSIEAEGQEFMEQFDKTQAKYEIKHAELTLEFLNKKKDELFKQIQTATDDLGKLKDPQEMQKGLDSLHNLQKIYTNQLTLITVQQQEIDNMKQTYKENVPTIGEQVKTKAAEVGKNTRSVLSNAAQSISSNTDEITKSTVDGFAAMAKVTIEAHNHAKTGLAAFGDGVKNFLNKVHEKFLDVGDKAYNNFGLRLENISNKYLESCINKDIEKLHVMEKTYKNIKATVENRESKKETRAKGFEIVKQGLNKMIGKDYQVKEVTVNRTKRDRSLMQEYENKIDTIRQRLGNNLHRYKETTQNIEKYMDNMNLGKDAVMNSFDNVKLNARVEMKIAENLVSKDPNQRSSMDRAVGDDVR